MVIFDFCFEEKFKDLAERQPIIPRDEIDKFFTFLSPRTMKNLDWRGEGPKGAFKLGKKVLYPTAELLKWLDMRVQGIPGKNAKKKGEAPQLSACSSAKRLGRKTKKQEVQERKGLA